MYLPHLIKTTFDNLEANIFTYFKKEFFLQQNPISFLSLLQEKRSCRCLSLINLNPCKHSLFFVKVDEKCSFPKMKAQKTCDKREPFKIGGTCTFGFIYSCLKLDWSANKFGAKIQIHIVEFRSILNQSFFKTQNKILDQCVSTLKQSLLSNFAISWKHILGLSSFT